MHTDGSGWPVVSSRTRELFRQGAELVLTAGEEEFADLHRAALTGLRSSAASDDPTLFEATRLVNTHNLRRWAAANITNPGERVVPQLSSEAINLARDVVRRGLDGRALDSYRTAQSVGWRRWMEVCFTLTSEAADLQDLLDISSLSISTYLDDTIDELTAVIESDIRDLNQGTNATRMATLTLLLEGAPIRLRSCTRPKRSTLPWQRRPVSAWRSAAADVTSKVSDAAT
ncbi:hypothetical protein [Mycolicibacterium sp. CBMA 295]|uniref:hypothetical protein n=1 Tax=Mycolicibacterium sp. CBMA 295 TaxID=2606605 RepID=UPI001EE4B403|nr:hypothetical protein [Mycolicibacterium sp. CBMA 295]